jgi:hypothetical protein
MHSDVNDQIEDRIQLEEFEILPSAQTNSLLSFSDFLKNQTAKVHKESILPIAQLRKYLTYVKNYIHPK